MRLSIGILYRMFYCDVGVSCRQFVSQTVSIYCVLMEQNKYITRNYYRSISTMTSVEIERGPVGGRRSYERTI